MREQKKTRSLLNPPPCRLRSVRRPTWPAVQNWDWIPDTIQDLVIPDVSARFHQKYSSSKRSRFIVASFYFLPNQKIRSQKKVRKFF